MDPLFNSVVIFCVIEKGNLISFLFVSLTNERKMLKERISGKEKILSFISFGNLSMQKHYSLVFIHVFTLNEHVNRQ